MSKAAYQKWVNKNIGTAVKDAINKANADALTGKKDKKITRQIRDKTKFVFDNTILDLSRAELSGFDLNTGESTNLPKHAIKIIYQNLRKLDHIIRSDPRINYVDKADQPTSKRTLRILFYSGALAQKQSWTASQQFIKLLLGQIDVIQWQDKSLAKKNEALDFRNLQLQSSGYTLGGRTGEAVVNAGHIQGDVAQLAGAIPVHGIVNQNVAKTIPEPRPVDQKVALIKNTLAYTAPNIADNFISKLLEDANSSLNKALKVSSTAKQELRSGLINSIFLKQTVTIELSKRNLTGGQAIRKRAAEVLHTYQDIINAHADDLADSITEEVSKFLKSSDNRISKLQIKSPGLMQNLEKSYVELWEENKARVRKSQSTVKAKVGKTRKPGKYKSKTPTKVNRVQDFPIDTYSILGNIGGINWENIMRVINERLHDQVQKNMGKGRARRLNYRSGRFARSAELVEIGQRSSRSEALDTAITYMRYPYDLFLDDGGTPPWKNGYRDPKKLIDKSIRQILREELGREYVIRSRLV